MPAWNRLVPVFAMGAIGILHVLLRPQLAAWIPHFSILEFPLGGLVLGFLLWLALGRNAPRPAPAVWRRHEQVVRELPDPAVVAQAAVLERWLLTGEGTSEAAAVLAKAAALDPREQEEHRAALARELTLTTTRRRRASILRRYTGA